MDKIKLIVIVPLSLFSGKVDAPSLAARYSASNVVRTGRSVNGDRPKLTPYRSYS
jgi:hypothetical protein